MNLVILFPFNYLVLIKRYEMTTVEKDSFIEEEIGKLKQKFATLMEDDLLFEEGRREELWAKYQASIQQTRKELERIVSSLH